MSRNTIVLLIFFKHLKLQKPFLADSCILAGGGPGLASRPCWTPPGPSPGRSDLGKKERKACLRGDSRDKARRWKTESCARAGARSAWLAQGLCKGRLGLAGERGGEASGVCDFGPQPEPHSGHPCPWALCELRKPLRGQGGPRVSRSSSSWKGRQACGIPGSTPPPCSAEMGTRRRRWGGRGAAAACGPSGGGALQLTALRPGG